MSERASTEDGQLLAIWIATSKRKRSVALGRGYPTRSAPVLLKGDVY